MRILYFQPFSGASGDMILGALVDAGLSVQELESELSKLRLDGWRLESRKELRGPFRATRLHVVLEKPPEGSPQAHVHRNLQDLTTIVQASSLAPVVKETSSAVFRRLAQAEAHVHGIPLEEVHFHEVGAVDSIVDVVGACLGIHMLEVDEVRSAPLTVGTGFVCIAHGKAPLPAPATLELLRGFPVRQEESDAELTTPTGAALLTTLAARFGTAPPVKVLSVGYGAGDDRPGPLPNALRVILGESAGEPGRAAPGALPPTDTVVVLETNIDDMSPQWIGHLIDRLFAAGALDVAVAPILMKKSRPAHEVKIMVAPRSEGDVLAALLRESTTFGVRRKETERVTLSREMRAVPTPWGDVSVKVGRIGQEIVTVSPEYEDLRAAAEEAGLPLKEMHRRILQEEAVRSLLSAKKET